MEGMLNKAKETIFKQYEEVLPRVAKSTSFYRPDAATPKSRSTDIPNIQGSHELEKREMPLLSL